MSKNKYYQYGLHSEKFGDDYELVNRLKKNTFQLMDRIRKSNSKYADICYYGGISNKDNKTAKAIKKYNGKVGRPKREIIGDTVGWHIHIYVYKPDGKMVSSFCEEVRIRVKYKLDKQGNNDIENTISYIERQCKSRWYSNNLSPKLESIRKKKSL